MVNPSVAEGQMVADALDMDVEDVLAALDEEESSRIELQDGYTLILVDIPSIEIRHEKESYTTIPLGILITSGEIVTVCTEDTPVLQAFLNNRVREFSTKKKLRFVYQILYRIAVLYQSDLRIIDKMRTEIEERVGDDTEEVDLIALHELESTLVYFATSLRANGVVLDRLTRYKRLEQYPEDKELLGDVIVENQQPPERVTVLYSAKLLFSYFPARSRRTLPYVRKIYLPVFPGTFPAYALAVYHVPAAIPRKASAGNHKSLHHRDSTAEWLSKCKLFYPDI